MTLDELFKMKGQLTWEIEVAQAKLQNVQKQLIEMENQTKVKPEVKPDENK